jgi:hypothetical protein
MKVKLKLIFFTTLNFSILCTGNNFFLKNISNPSNINIEKRIFNNKYILVKSLAKKEPKELNKIKKHSKKISKSL